MPELPEQTQTTSPAKLALVGVLGVIFVVVLIVQFGGVSGAEQTEPAANDTDGRRPSSPAAAQPRSAGAGRATVERVARRWPVLDAADVLRWDPFSFPPVPSEQVPDNEAPAPQPEPIDPTCEKPDEAARQRAARERELAAIQQQGVTAVIGSRRKGHLAIVGSETVEVGDHIGAFLVVAIEPDGVVLQELDGEHVSDTEPPAHGADSSDGESCTSTADPQPPPAQE